MQTEINKEVKYGKEEDIKKGNKTETERRKKRKA